MANGILDNVRSAIYSHYCIAASGILYRDWDVAAYVHAGWHAVLAGVLPEGGPRLPRLVDAHGVTHVAVVGEVAVRTCPAAGVPVMVMPETWVTVTEPDWPFTLET